VPDDGVARLLYDALIIGKDLMDPLTQRLEALFYISPRPITTAELAAACDVDEAAVAEAVTTLMVEYGAGRHGFELTEIAGGYTFRIATASEAAVRSFTGARPPERLSPALIETLSVVAYLQPATRADVAQIRGVSSEWALSSLEERGLIEECGRADTPGTPILYRTTAHFLKLFGLRDLSSLPALSEFAMDIADVEELRTHLLVNAERRTS
jgi:segregation and condensation protein B